MGYVSQKFWDGKKVFITGHSGFKGSWLSVWLTILGARVTGYSLAPDSTNGENLFQTLDLPNEIEKSIIGDILNYEHLVSEMTAACPEVVFHLAAQPLVSTGYYNPKETFSVNALGTSLVLDACAKQSSVQTIINITTDKVYKNENGSWPHRETDRLGGFDPYSASKACSELIAASFHHSFFAPQQINSATCRAGNVVGGGDWSEGRLIPDCMRAIRKKTALKVRNINAVRPWQHVLESLAGYLQAAQYLANESDSPFETWNFGPPLTQCCSVGKVLSSLKEIEPSLTWHSALHTKFNEAETLKLDSSKARTELGWDSKWNLSETLAKTLDWYSSWFDKDDMKIVTRRQIQDYMQK